MRLINIPIPLGVESQAQFDLQKCGYFYMQITKEQILKYQAIYKEEYSQEIDEARAIKELSSLVCLLEAVYQHNNK